MLLYEAATNDALLEHQKPLGMPCHTDRFDAGPCFFSHQRKEFLICQFKLFKRNFLISRPRLLHAHLHKKLRPFIVQLEVKDVGLLKR